jgi:hypothetical protein
MNERFSSHTFAWLRSALLRRGVAFAFLLAIGLAAASPLIKPQSIELLCTSGGAMKLLLKSADGDAQSSAHTVPCGLCALGDGLLPTVLPLLAPVQAHTQAAPAAFISAPVVRTQPPLPARGPPALS